MSESRPLANTLPQPRVGKCPLFNPDQAAQSAAATQDRSWAVAGFGLGTVALTLIEAIYRLGARAMLTLREELTVTQWATLVVSVLALAYGEGYRALHRRFVPHVIERASELAVSGPSYLNTGHAMHTLHAWRTWLLSPLYVLCLVQAQPAALRRAWLSVTLIAGAVMVVRQLPEPYRGIIDAGVAVALSIGLASLSRGFFIAVRGKSRAT